MIAIAAASVEKRAMLGSRRATAESVARVVPPCLASRASVVRSWRSTALICTTAPTTYQLVESGGMGSATLLA